MSGHWLLIKVLVLYNRNFVYIVNQDGIWHMACQSSACAGLLRKVWNQIILIYKVETVTFSYKQSKLNTI